MNRLNFEINAFCFEDQSKTGFHRSARTSHHFFVLFGPSWLNDCLQGVQNGLVTSWNILFQRRPDGKVRGTNIRALGCPHFLVSKPCWFGPASPDWQPKAQGRLSELRQCPEWRFFLLKSFCEPRKNFFSVTYSNKIGCWLSSAQQWTSNEICSRLKKHQLKPYSKHVSLV